MVGTTIEAAARKGESGFGYQRSVDHRVKTCKPARGTTSPTQRVQIATDKRKHDLSSPLPPTLLPHTQEKETRGEGRGRLPLHSDAQGFFLSVEKYIGFRFALPHDLKPRIASVIKPQEICIRSDTHTHTHMRLLEGEKKRHGSVIRFERSTAVERAEGEVVYSDFNFSKLERVAQLSVAPPEHNTKRLIARL